MAEQSIWGSELTVKVNPANERSVESCEGLEGGKLLLLMWESISLFCVSRNKAICWKEKRATVLETVLCDSGQVERFL